jgi:ribosomal protein S8
MSPQNLAHVCSHLQNTSRARLAKTSIKLTRLHLQVALALQKQGFVSTVEIGGKRPPQPPKDTILPRHADILEYEQYKSLLSRLRQSDPEIQQLEPWTWLPSGRAESQTTASGQTQQQQERRLDLEPTSILSESAYESRPWMLYYKSAGHAPLDELLQDPEKIRRSDSVSLLSYEAWQTHTNSLAHGNQTSSPELLADEPWRSYPDPHPYFSQPGIRTAPDPWLQVPDNPAQRRIWLGLKYWRNEPVMSSCHVVSKGTRRVTMTLQEISTLVRGDMGRSNKGVLVKGLRLVGECMFFLTDAGVLEARECIEKRRGGLALCRIA